MSWEIPLSNLPLQVWPSPITLVEAFLENQRQQPTFLWEATTLKTNKQRALRYLMRVEAFTVFGNVGVGGNPCMSRTLILWRSHDSSYNSLYTEQFPDPSMSVTTFILCILLNIIPLFICAVVFCKHLFIVVAVDGFLPRKGTGLRWLISSYQTIHAVRLFYSLYDSLPSPPQCNIQCNLCYMSPVLNGSSLTAHADSPISYITYFQMTIF